jgi:hypothetical protein
LNYDPLNKAIEDATRAYWTFPSSFSDISEKYKEIYGERAWQGKLATAITGAKPAGQSGFAKGTDEYKAANTKYKTARKQVERHTTGEHKGFKLPSAREKLAEIGKTLDPLTKDAPPGGITFTIKFKAPGDSEHSHSPRQRVTPPLHLDHQQAVQYINQEQPGYDTLFDEYFSDGGNCYGEDAAYEADIVSVSAE